jgi:hypothetical protein
MLLLLLSLSSDLILGDIKVAQVVIRAQVVVKHVNVFYRYFAQYGYFDRAESSVFQVR